MQDGGSNTRLRTFITRSSIIFTVIQILLRISNKVDIYETHSMNRTATNEYRMLVGIQKGRERLRHKSILHDNIKRGLKIGTESRKCIELAHSRVQWYSLSKQHCMFELHK
jgi:hypothetical protein